MICLYAPSTDERGRRKMPRHPCRNRFEEVGAAVIAWKMCPSDHDPVHAI